MGGGRGGGGGGREESESESGGEEDCFIDTGSTGSWWVRALVLWRHHLRGGVRRIFVFAPNKDQKSVGKQEEEEELELNSASGSV
jgi:hypothetical protein